MKYLGKKTENEDLATQNDFSSYVTTNTDQTISGAKTFSKPVVVNSNETYGLEVNSTSKGGYLKVQRGTGNSAVTMAIKSGSSGGTFGTVTNHQFQFRTNDTARMVIGTDGSVVLSSDVASNSDSNQVATTKWTNSKLANKQDILATTLTADIYLVDGTAPTLADGIYYTGTHKIYVNGTEATNFRMSMFTVSYDGEGVYYIEKFWGVGYPVANIYYNIDDEHVNAYSYSYTSFVKQTDITTTIPPNVSSSYWDKKVPSTKLFKTQLDLKANSSSLGSLATMSSIDYTSNYITNKPTIPNGALASLDSIDYTSNYITNKPTIPTSAADVGAMPASSVTTAFWTGTQAEYDALGSYSSTTLYLIHE